MKLKIVLSLLVMILAMSSSYASFPVKRAVVSTEVGAAEADELFSPAAQSSQKSQGIAVLLLVFLGAVAAHRWYLGSPWYWNVLFILTLGGLGIWALADLIRILTGDYEPRNGSFKNEFF